VKQKREFAEPTGHFEHIPWVRIRAVDFLCHEPSLSVLPRGARTKHRPSPDVADTGRCAHGRRTREQEGWTHASVRRVTASQPPVLGLQFWPAVRGKSGEAVPFPARPAGVDGASRRANESTARINGSCRGSTRPAADYVSISGDRLHRRRATSACGNWDPRMPPLGVSPGCVSPSAAAASQRLPTVFVVSPEHDSVCYLAVPPGGCLRGYGSPKTATASWNIAPRKGEKSLYCGDGQP